MDVWMQLSVLFILLKTFQKEELGKFLRDLVFKCEQDKANDGGNNACKRGNGIDF